MTEEIIKKSANTFSKIDKLPTNENKLNELWAAKKQEEISKPITPQIRYNHRYDSNYIEMRKILSKNSKKEEELDKKKLNLDLYNVDIKIKNAPKFEQAKINKKILHKGTNMNTTSSITIDIPIKTNEEKIMLAQKKLQEQVKSKTKFKLSQENSQKSKNIITSIIEEIDLNQVEDNSKKVVDVIMIEESKTLKIKTELHDSQAAILPVSYKKLDPYQNYLFTTENIYDLVLNLEYLFGTKYLDEFNSFLFDKEAKIPNTFTSISQYVFLWTMHYFIELKSQLLSNKVERFEKDKFNDIMIYFTNRKGDIISKSNTYDVNFLSDHVYQDLKLFRENDLFIIFEKESDPIFHEVRSLDTLETALKNYQAKSNLPYNCSNNSFKNVFLGIFYFEKHESNEQKNLICKVHSNLNVLNTNENYRLRLICNLTTNIREFEGVLNSSKYFLKELILDPKQFLKTSSSKCLITKEINLKGKINDKQSTYLKNCKNHFNDSQYEGIIHSANLNLSDILLIQGPPGTGKTHTIIGIISMIYLKTNSNILVCTPSNMAIDEITLRLAKNGLYTEEMCEFKPEIIRFGLCDKGENNLIETSENSNLLKHQTLEYKVDLKFKGKETQV